MRWTFYLAGPCNTYPCRATLGNPCQIITDIISNIAGLSKIVLTILLTQQYISVLHLRLYKIFKGGEGGLEIVRSKWYWVGDRGLIGGMPKAPLVVGV